VGSARNPTDVLHATRVKNAVNKTTKITLVADEDTSLDSYDTNTSSYRKKRSILQ
jgi:hypothetical protein